jgi:hypothetical protein
MENLLIGTYEEITLVYQRLGAALRTPSGYPNIFRGIN